MSGLYNPQILSEPMLEYAWVLLHVDSAAGLLLDRSLKGLFKTWNEEPLAATRESLKSPSRGFGL